MSVANDYRNLLLEYLPRPIRSDRDYRRALAQMEKLMVPKPGAARGRLIEVLSTLIENYESRECPAPQVSPSQMLTHLLEARGVKCAEVAKKTGISPATLSSILAGRRGVSKAIALKLAGYFNVSPIFFLDCPSDRKPARELPR
jgi:HTH-type transcriptional regulator/antitoxin HigA